MFVAVLQSLSGFLGLHTSHFAIVILSHFCSTDWSPLALFKSIYFSEKISRWHSVIYLGFCSPCWQSIAAIRFSTKNIGDGTPGCCPCCMDSYSLLVSDLPFVLVLFARIFYFLFSLHLSTKRHCSSFSRKEWWLVEGCHVEGFEPVTFRLKRHYFSPDIYYLGINYAPG